MPQRRGATQSILDRSVEYSLAEEESQYSYIGTPPYLPWEPRSVRPLDALRQILNAAPSPPRRPVVSLLAVVIDVHAPADTASGKVKATWDLADKSGALVTLTLWGPTATHWCSAIQRGDVVFLGSPFTFRPV